MSSFKVNLSLLKHIFELKHAAKSYFVQTYIRERSTYGK
ncbi:hypothetical protein B0I27_10888 [Arcticibacter pallidicorallinus]|uniref:Uncharacterized protein n=1 Tax=Arcticibacter pallidicorallinus TaxID=1259464 RepID=A0A2T0TYZ9_9SPHI|nr:hypothetical protein B0I27_10888 [Arcticibacter pallidicorallinus]